MGIVTKLSTTVGQLSTMPRVPIYPSQPVRFPSPRSGLTQADVVAARAPTKRTDTHTESGSGEKPARLKSAAEEFRQSIRIDIGGLEMRAQEGKGSRFEAARKFCELQHSLVALTTTSTADKLAALADIDVAVNTLDARFPGVFAGAKDLVVSAREAMLISEEIKILKRDFEAADLENATFLLEGAASSSSSPSPNDIASLRAAESTKVTLPPLKMHVEMGVQGLRRTVELVESVAKLSMEIDKLLEELLSLQVSHLSGRRLLTAEVAILIDQILLHGSPGEVALSAKLGVGLNELRLTHKDPEMRAEMSRVLACCFEPGDTQPTRSITGERRLQMRVAFLLTEGPKLPPGAKCLEDFAFKLVDDIKRDIGENSLLMRHLLDKLEALPGFDGLAAEIYERSWS